MTREQAKELVEPYKWKAELRVEVVNAFDVITLLMEHSNPSTVLEEVKKYLMGEVNRMVQLGKDIPRGEGTRMKAFADVVVMIDELQSKGKV